MRYDTITVCFLSIVLTQASAIPWDDRRLIPFDLPAAPQDSQSNHGRLSYEDVERAFEAFSTSYNLASTSIPHLDPRGLRPSSAVRISSAVTNKPSSKPSGSGSAPSRASVPIIANSKTSTSQATIARSSSSVARSSTKSTPLATSAVSTQNAPLLSSAKTAPTSKTPSSLKTASTSKVSSLVKAASTSQTSSSVKTASTSKTSSSRPESASATPLLIIPKNTTTKADKDKFQSSLAQMLGSKVKILSIENPITGAPDLWKVPLSPAQATQIKANPIIAQVVPDSPASWIRDDNIKSNLSTTKAPGRQSMTRPRAQNLTRLDERGIPTKKQQDAPEHLQIVSLPRNRRGTETLGYYEYEATAGRGVTVYVLDSGANTKHPDYKLMPGNKRWMYPGFIPLDEDQNDKDGHGTSVLSVLGGAKFGVAKDIDVVVVKLDKASLQGRPFTGMDIADAFAKMAKDIRKRSLQGKAVITTSFTTALNSELKSLIADYIDLITTYDVPIVVSAGNTFGTSVNAFPAAFAANHRGIILAGSSDYDNEIAAHSTIDRLISVYAPSQDIVCAHHQGEHMDDTQTRTGTSFAAPIVAGLAAYIMSLHHIQWIPGEKARDVRLVIESLGFARNSGGPKIISNGIDQGVEKMEELVRGTRSP